MLQIDGNLDKALELAYVARSEYPEVQYHLGMGYHKQGNQETARQALQQALKLNANFPGADEARRVLAQMQAL